MSDSCEDDGHLLNQREHSLFSSDKRVVFMKYSSNLLMVNYSRHSRDNTSHKRDHLDQSVPFSKRKVIRIKKKNENSEIFNNRDISISEVPARAKVKLNKQELVFPKLKR